MSSSGRATGTVPKVKARPNENTRNPQEHRRPTVSNVPNNLQASSLEWQQSSAQAPSSLQSRARKPRNTRQSSQRLFDGSFDLQSSHERLRPHTSDSLLHCLQTDFQMENEKAASFEDRLRRRDASSSTQSICNPRCSQEQPHNTLLDTKNNISRIPDRNQVLSRLNQIRDYVKQTSALMDSLRGSSDPHHIIQVIKLSHMNADLRDSESRLETLLKTLNTLAEGPEVLPDSPMTPQSPPNGLQSQNRSHMGSDNMSMPHSGSRSVSEEPDSMPTAAQYAKHQELKLKVEESQKKLLALQEHQAALVALQQKAQQQLHEAQAQQGALLATAVGDSQTTSVNFDNLNGRMQTLQELILNRNEVAHLLDEQDEELEVEHSVLQERLQELHGRKQAMDRLVHELKVLGETDLVASANRVDAHVHQNGYDENHVESCDEEEEAEQMSVVSDKLEELNRMKARLSQLQSMVAAVSRGEIPHETVKAALVDTNPQTEERIVRAQRSKRESESSTTKPDNIVLSSEGTPNCLEAQMMDIKIKTDQLNKAKQRLQQLKDLLGSMGVADDTDDGDDHNENSTSGMQQQSISIEAAQALGRELLVQSQNIRSEQEQLAGLQQGTAKVMQQASSSQTQTTNQAKNKNQESSQRRTIRSLREDASSRQLALQAELQAKRQELEELMHKDQGQSSSLNQDTCSEAGFSLPETSATWGGSSSSQTALLATVDQEADAQEQSMVCSSDDALEEPLMDARTPTSQLPTNSRQRQQSLPPLPPNASSYQSSWNQYRSKYDIAHKDTPDSRSATPRVGAPWMRPGMSPAGPHEVMGPTYDLPGSMSNSGATPRPPSEAGSTNTQSMPWWPMQVQQQLEATSAMYQAMMQQWQWGTPSPEPWWNMQGPMPHVPLHQQQLAISLSQCCQMLWMQHRELAALQATVQNLQERITCAERFGLAAAAAGAGASGPLESNQPTSHQPLKVSLSTGLFPTSSTEQGIGAGTPSTASGVSSAHSLPNLCDGQPSLSQPPNTQYMLPPHPSTTQFPWMTPPHGARSSTATASPNNPGLPSLLRHGPPVTLNNQVPPGIRANNYWDNFRSYSRQNLLSASTKSNEGHLHNPSPIADRSHNSLRGAEPQQVAASSTVNSSQPTRSRKQKLNTEQRQPATSMTHNPSVSPMRQPPIQVRQPISSPSSSQHRASSSAVLLQESLYNELTTLMAQNQSRPDFLPQLFRELQALSCDTLCQQALQSIREISHNARVDSRNSDHTTNQIRPRSRESLGSVSGDKDEMSLGTHGIVSSEVNMSQPLLEEVGDSSDASPDSTEGATALPLHVSSTSNSSRPSQRSIQLVPSLESCSMDLQGGATVSAGSHGQFDVEIQSLLLQLLPFLKAHREECCSPALLEAVRQRTLSLVPPPVTGLNGFIQGQLDALLEDALLKFQGCWLRDVREEVLATIAEVLLNELTFFKLLDTVTRPLPPHGAAATPDSSSALHPEQPCQSSGQHSASPHEELLEADGEVLGAVGPALPQPPHNCWLPSRMRDSPLAGWDARKEAAVTAMEAESILGCNGDLAEADQSHEDARLSDMAGGVSTSTSLGEGVASGRNSQAEGIATGDDSNSDVAEDEMDNLEELGAVSLGDSQVPTEDEGWNVEQDRELDQVPTRLEPGSNSSSAPQQAEGPTVTQSGSPRP